MASGESEYLPPLDRCLDGNHLLVSWKRCFVALTYVTDWISRENAALERFLSDQSTTRLLCRPFSAFPPPNEHSKRAFETRTAAIHVTSTTNGNYNIEEIKQDALWLSNEAKIDEVSALRITIIERQSSSSAQLLRGFSDTEIASIQDAVGNDASGSSFLLAMSSMRAAPSNAQHNTFNSLTSRKLRLVMHYLSERRHIIKVAEVLVRAAVSEAFSTTNNDRNAAANTKAWVLGIGKTLLNARRVGEDSIGGFQPLVAECIDALQTRADDLERGSGISIDGDCDDEIELEWGKCLLLELSHIGQMVFGIISSTQDTIPSSVILPWLRFICKYQFFERFQNIPEAHQVYVVYLQSLVSIVSLTMLKLPVTIRLVCSYDDRESRHSSKPTSFIFDSSAVNEINTLLFGAARDYLLVASPTIFAWSMILQAVREVVNMPRPARKSHQTTAEDFLEDSQEPFEGPSNASRQRSTSSDRDSSVLEKMLQSLPKISSDKDPIRQLAEIAGNDCEVFNVVLELATNFCKLASFESPGKVGAKMRIVLLELVRYSLEWVQYLPEVILAAEGLLTGGDNFYSIIERARLPPDLNAAAEFLRDHELLVPRLLNVAYARFPFETIPFLKLVKALSAGRDCDDDGILHATTVLELMGSITVMLPNNFKGYDTFREDQNDNQVLLTSDLRLFSERRTNTIFSGTGSRNQLALTVSSNDATRDEMVIPFGTTGRVIREEGPVVVQWIYEYSGLKFLGRLLESALPHSVFVDNLLHCATNNGVVAEIIGLFAMLLSATARARVERPDPEGIEAAHKLLNAASQGVRRNGDIITVIFDHFENAVQEIHLPGTTDGALDVLISSVQFIWALVPVVPGRVWPLLARSKLLNVDGRGGRLGDILASTEIIIGRFEFLSGCIRVFEALVEDAITHAVARTSPSSSLSRTPTSDTIGTGVTAKAMSDILLALVRAMVDVLESFSNWKFTSLDEKQGIVSGILDIFNNILHFVYGADNHTKPEQKLTGMFAAAAKHLTEVFLSSSASNLPVQPLLKILADGVSTPYSTIFIGGTQAWIRQTRIALKYAIALIRLASSQGLSRSYLEMELFKLSPILVRVYTANDAYKSLVVELLEAMVTDAASVDEEPPSLLGPLGSDSAKLFFNVLADFSLPLEDEDLDVNIWNLMSAVMSKRQQWFAIYLLTGNVPRDSLKKPIDKADATRRTVLSKALDGLSRIDKLSSRTARAMLKFVAVSGDFWPWSISEWQNHSTFLKRIFDYITTLQTLISVNDTSKAETTCDALQLASLIGEVLALYLHQCRQWGDISSARTLLARVANYAKNAVTMQGYNPSLHSNLRRNFESRFPGCKLSSFERTKSERAPLGSYYVYCMDISEKMLSYDSSWLGVRGSGFHEEFKRASLNLSLIEARLRLLRSWRLLAIELSNTFLQERSLQEVLANTVNECLIANTNSDLPESIFYEVFQIRTDFAFVLLQKLVGAKSTHPDMKKVLFTAWDTIKTSQINIELALVGNDAEYYRSLLRVVLLSLRVHADERREHLSGSFNRSLSKPKNGTMPSLELQLVVLDIIDVIVARGFRALAAAVHESRTDSSPEDIALVTAILQTSLHIPEIDVLHLQICTKFAEADTARVAATLFSWSDGLAINGDPIYGELAMLFLMELSSIRLMAEQLAVDGILSQLLNSKLVASIRRGVGPFSRTPRVYSIWVRGILRLCLNLLLAVGPPTAPEVSEFLNQFEAQLALASANFDNKPTSSDPSPNNTAGYITLSTASEAHALALIHRILEGFRAAGASTGVLTSEILSLQWDATTVREDIEYWLESRNGLRQRILPINELEEELTREKPRRKDRASENRFEEELVDELTNVVTLLNG